MADIKSIDGLDAAGKRVLVRVDFNVPVKDGVVTDDTRIRAALPTIEKLVADGARVVLMSHLGRPAGEGFEDAYTLRPAAQRLSELLGRPVVFATDTVGPDAKAKAASLRDGDVLVVENLRFDKREKKNDPAFCEELATPRRGVRATTRSAPRTGHTPPRRASRRCCRRTRATSCSARWARSRACSEQPEAPLRRHPGRLEGV